MNTEQKIAVINIIECNNGPVPYILDGPPGTGKTRVLVAAVEEIVKNYHKDNFVLVCSNSNAACDELFDRLCQVLDHHEILRIYTASHDPQKVKSDHLKLSNWEGHAKSFTMPGLPYLYQIRVLVCTLAVASCLTRANQHPSFKADHFSHVIIDECCCTHESMTMVPIAGNKCLLKLYG